MSLGFTEHDKRIFSIPAGANFLGDLAEALAREFDLANNPEALADALIYVPNRRSERALAFAIHKAAGVAIRELLALEPVDENAEPLLQRSRCGPHTRPGRSRRIAHPGDVALRRSRGELWHLQVHQGCLRSHLGPQNRDSANHHQLRIVLEGA